MPSDNLVSPTKNRVCARVSWTGFSNWLHGNTCLEDRPDRWFNIEWPSYKAGCQEPFLALLDWRNTPSEAIQLSPTHVVFGRRTRTLMPISDNLLYSTRIRETMKASSWNKRHFTTCLPREDLNWMSDRLFKSDDRSDWQKGSISKMLYYRSYEVRLQDGTTRKRTSKHVPPSPTFHRARSSTNQRKKFRVAFQNN